ncbi:MAG TPA: YqiA/YcfP family alpha/beta fold hydrolase [Trichocoleus sp.]|jgi:predicted esterase YcpF (UPF0227 family)
MASFNLRNSSHAAVYIYLHGFASSPQSTKAQFLRDRFQALGIDLILPDLNQPDFYQLTLTRQIQQVQALLPQDVPVTLIGSSFGGLTAAWVAEQCEQVERSILLAPAFQFLDQWLPRLGEAQLNQWKQQNSLQVYHYSNQQMMPLSYQFVTDLMQYSERQLQRPVSTLILHGQQDEVISVQASRDFANLRSWVKLIELNSDHALTNVQDEIWQEVMQEIRN